MTKDRSVYIRHIFDCISRIKDYVRDGKETFLSDRKTQDAVIRNLEVIGQAVKDLGSDTLSTQSAIPWKQIAGTRDILAHQYLGVDIKLVWNIVEKHLPKLEKAIRDIAKRERIDLD
ncbi:MAG: DUF86 domain-containing protein [Acidiferrobacterales bacterium]